MTTREARRIAELQLALDEERRKRLAAEQRAAGLRSAVLRMQAMIAKKKAEAAETLARSAPGC